VNPTFSIVVPTFGRPGALAGCLAALERLDYPRDGFEVIVVDDGSPAPVEASADGVALRVERVPHGGPARARNHGVAVARGRYVAFTDDDCAPAPDWLTALQGPLAGGAAAAAGRSANAVPGNTCASAGQALLDHLYRYYNRDPADARFATSNNLAVERETLLAVGGFDEAFSHAAGEDRELVHRLRARGHRIAYEPRAIVRHAHRQDLRAYWGQHYGYGAAAMLFRKRAGAVPVEPVSFYVDLLRGSRARVVALLVIAQVANALGFARASLRYSGPGA
jgi:glycosyltransferase involved in cell wall biosynthesis